MSTTTDPDLNLLQAAVGNLAEHFDTVQIFCTRHVSIERSTEQFLAGSGNLYARFGQVKQWVIEEEARVRSELDNNED